MWQESHPRSARKYQNGKNRVILFDPSNSIGIIDKVIRKLYPASYRTITYVDTALSNASTHISILAGAGDEVSQINTPGTAAQTKMVRIISQTAVIFSTIDSIHFYLPI